MLYSVFTFFMIILSIMGIVHMVAFETYTYLIFPISTFIWGFYKFFKENDDEYCRRNNIDNSGLDVGWLLGLGDDSGYYGQYGSNSYYDGRGYNTYNHNAHHQVTSTKYQYHDPEYKKILSRCRRNSMVTTEKVKTK